MSDWDEFNEPLLEALRRFVQGDAEPVKSLWSHADDVMIFGGWGASKPGWLRSNPAWIGPRPGMPELA